MAPSLVSHALSGKRPVTVVTRERIVTAARESGYEPNATAGNARARRTRTVGLSLLLDSAGRTLSHGPFAEYVADIADLLAAHDHALHCLVARAPEVSDLARLVRGGRLEGLILLQMHLDDPRVHASTGDSMLTVLAQPPITAVCFSVADQCRRAAELLVGRMNAVARTLRISHPGPSHRLRHHGPARAGPWVRESCRT